MAQFTPDQADALADAMKKSLVEQKDRLIGISEASDKVTSSLGGVLNSYAAISKKSTLWNFMSRMVSGVLPGFWSLQNKVRAVGLAVHMWNEQTSKALEEQSKFIDKVAESDETLQRLKDTLSDIEAESAGTFHSFDLHKLKDFQSYVKFYGKTLALKKLDIIYSKKIKTEEKNQIKLAKQSLKLKLSEMGKGKTKKILTSLGSQGHYYEDMIQRGMTVPSLKKFKGLGGKQQSIVGKMFRGDKKGNEQFKSFMKMYDLRRGLMGNSFKFFKGNLKDSYDNFKKTFPGKMKEGLKSIFKGWAKVMLIIGKALLLITLLGIILWGLKQSGLLNTIKDTAIWFKNYLVDVVWPMLQIAWNGVKDMFKGIWNLFSGEGKFIDNIELIIGGFFKLAVGSFFAIAFTLWGVVWAGVKLVFQGLMDTLKIWRDEGWDGLGKGLKQLGKWVTSILMLLSVGVAIWAIIAAGVSVLTAGAALAGAALIIGTVGAGIDKFASGGISPGGMALVGERGPEFVNLPRGARVHSNAESRKMAGNNITINVNGRVGASDTELRDIARKVGRLVSQEINRTTSSSTVHR